MDMQDFTGFPYLPKAIKITRQDFNRLPDDCRKIGIGRPRILATIQGRQRFVPVQIVEVR